MDELTVHQIMGEALVVRGLATPEDVQSDRAALEARLAGQDSTGAEQPLPEASTARPQPAEQPQVDPMDALIFRGADSPASYNFGVAPNGIELSFEQETTFRNLFHQEGIPASIGNEIGRLWNQAVVNPPSEDQLERSRQECSVALHHLWGADTQKNLAIAQAEVQRLAKSNPNIVEMLETSGLGNNPWLIASVVNMAKAKGRAL